jgi:ribose 5-phosphate isomerase B
MTDSKDTQKIAIAGDHAAFEAKEKIKAHFSGIDFKDFGTHSKESVDYPDVIYPACKAVADGIVQKGIVLCGTGIGASITANKVKGIRAALCHNKFTVEMSRKHNDANILVLGARVLEQSEILELIEIWLKTKFEGSRHSRRIEKIHALE